MPDARDADLERLFGQIPCGLFVMSTAHDGERAGILTRWVQPCSRKPPLIMVAVATGLAIEPVLRESRHFALAQVPDGDRLLLRRFAEPHERGEDVFISIPHFTAPAGSPVPERALAWYECQVVRHVDVEGDHRLYVGKVIDAALAREDVTPAVELFGSRVAVGEGTNGTTDRASA